MEADVLGVRPPRELDSGQRGGDDRRNYLRVLGGECGDGDNCRGDCHTSIDAVVRLALEAR